ncbi:MAG: sugar ABC transporter substrate-binding protein [Candidatus Rokubacteria bacterium]|nr:sugar ABC transporter substrate-binding protein [Candidatus Rokubacteria bacterium]
MRRNSMRHGIRALVVGVGAPLMLGLAAPAFAQFPRPEDAKINWRQFEGQTISVIYQKSFLMDKVFEMLPDFQKLTGIKVEHEGYSENAMWEKIVLDSTSKVGAYDAFQIAPFLVPKYAVGRWTADLGKFMNDAKLTDPRWYDYDDFLPSLRNSMRVGAYVVGVPIDGFPGALFYRRDMFQKYGIQVPKTMKELVQAAEKVTAGLRKDGEKHVWAIGLRGAWYQFMLPAFIYSEGGAYLAGQRPGTSNPLASLIEDPRTVEGMRAYVELMRKHAPPGYANIAWPEMLEDFRAGKLAMTIEPLVFAVQYEDAKKSNIVGKVGVASIPGRNGPGEPGFWDFGLGISTFSKKQGAAWYWVQWTTAKAQALRLSKARGITSRKSVTELAEWKSQVEKWNNGDWLRVYGDLGRARPDYHVTTLAGQPLPQAEEVLKSVGIEVQAAIAGQKDIAQAARDAAKAVELALKKR